MKRYKNPWKNKQAWPPWPKVEEKKVEEVKKIEEKEEVSFQIDSKLIADLISRELVKKEKTQTKNLNSDKILLILIICIAILVIFVIVIAFISLSISFQSNESIKLLTKLIK